MITQAYREIRIKADKNKKGLVVDYSTNPLIHYFN